MCNTQSIAAHKAAGRGESRGPVSLTPPHALHFRRASLGAAWSLARPCARSPRRLWSGTRTGKEEAPGGQCWLVRMARSGWVPPRLDGFILTERLGSGTYATVYKAYAKVSAGRGRNRGRRTLEGPAPVLARPRASPGGYRGGKLEEVRDSMRAVRCSQPVCPGRWTR